MSESKNIKIRIIEKIQEFNHANGGAEPDIIFLTKAEEDEFRNLTPNDIGDLVSKIETQGVRNAIPQILGIQIKWDAEKFEVK